MAPWTGSPSSVRPGCPATTLSGDEVGQVDHDVDVGAVALGELGALVVPRDLRGPPEARLPG